jgi:hypothetical protein
MKEARREIRDCRRYFVLGQTTSSPVEQQGRDVISEEWEYDKGKDAKEDVSSI